MSLSNFLVMNLAVVNCQWFQLDIKLRLYLCTQKGTSMSGGWEGLNLPSGSEAKFGARFSPGFSQVHQIKGKIWELLLLQNAKIWKKSQFWGYIRAPPPPDMEVPPPSF